MIFSDAVARTLIHPPASRLSLKPAALASLASGRKQWSSVVLARGHVARQERGAHAAHVEPMLWAHAAKLVCSKKCAVTPRR